MGNKKQNKGPAVSSVGTLEEFNKLEICPAQDESLEQLNTYLSNKSYILGWGLSASDEAVFSKVRNDIDEEKYPHVARWSSHVGSFASTQGKVGVVTKLMFMMKKMMMRMKNQQRQPKNLWAMMMMMMMTMMVILIPTIWILMIWIIVMMMMMKKPEP